jgi:hypothetical protein
MPELVRHVEALPPLLRVGDALQVLHGVVLAVFDDLDLPARLEAQLLSHVPLRRLQLRRVAVAERRQQRAVNRLQMAIDTLTQTLELTQLEAAQAGRTIDMICEAGIKRVPYWRKAARNFLKDFVV